MRTRDRFQPPLGVCYGVSELTYCMECGMHHVAFSDSCATKSDGFWGAKPRSLQFQDDYIGLAGRKWLIKVGD